jgi:hypothetical protein
VTGILALPRAPQVVPPSPAHLTFGSVLGPYDRPNFQNDIAPIVATSPNIRNCFFKSIERSENIASVRITPHPKWFMLARLTLDLVCHDTKPCLTRQRLIAKSS